MSDDAAQAERIRQLKERRSASATQPDGVRPRPNGRKKRAAVATRAATGALSISAFVAVTAAMGPVFASEPVDHALNLPPTATTTWAAPVPTSPPSTATVPPAPVTIIVQVRREYLVSGSGSTGQPSTAPAPAPSTGTPAVRSPSPAPTPAAPTTTAAPPPPAPPPPPTAAANPPLTGGS